MKSSDNVKWYIDRAREMQQSLVGNRRPTSTHSVTQSDALAWFDQEWTTLEHLVEEAARREAWEAALQLAKGCFLYLILQERWAELQEVSAVGAAAAAHIGDVFEELGCMQALAIAFQHTDRDKDAIALLVAIDQRAEQYGNVLIRARALSQLAQVLDNIGYYDQANERYRQARILYREANDREGEARTLGDLANMLDNRKAVGAALQIYGEAAEAFHSIGNKLDEAIVYSNIGLAHGRQANWHEARTAFERASQLFGELQLLDREAEIAFHLAEIQWRLGDVEQAEGWALRALQVLQRDSSDDDLDSLRALLRHVAAWRQHDVLLEAEDSEWHDLIEGRSELLTVASSLALRHRIDLALEHGQAESIERLRRLDDFLGKKARELAQRENQEIWAQYLQDPGSDPLPEALGPLLLELGWTDDVEKQSAILKSALELLINPAHVLLRIELTVRFLDWPLASRAEHFELAIAHLRGALDQIDVEAEPQLLANVRYQLGRAYHHRRLGRRSENIEEAIALFRRALAGYRRMEAPLQWASVMNSLANAYNSRIHGDRSRNIERAISRFTAALQEFPRAAAPDAWLLAQFNLGHAYFERAFGNRAENLELAIRHYSLARSAVTTTMPGHWQGIILAGLGDAYLRRLKGDRSANLKESILYFEQAFETLIAIDDGLGAARAASGLGNAFLNLIQGDRSENIEQAIRWFERSLELLDLEDNPQDWASITDELANAYRVRIAGDQADNLEKAKELHRVSLNAFAERHDSFNWAATAANLARTMAARIRGSMAQNLETAIDLFEKALEIQRQHVNPLEWAQLHASLADVYARRLVGDQHANLQHAVECYRKALEIIQPETMPVDTTETAHSLAHTLMRLGKLEEAVKAYEVALQGADRLYQASILRSSRDMELIELARLPQCATYALAKTDQLAQAVVTLERGRARALGETIGRDRADLGRLEMSNPELAAAFKKAVLRLQKVEAEERSYIGSSTGPNHKGAEEDALHARAQDAGHEFSAVLARVRLEPGFTGFLAEPSFDDIERVVRAGDTYVYLLTSETESLALLLHRDEENSACRLEAIWLHDFTEQLVTDLFTGTTDDGGASGYLEGLFLGKSALYESLEELLVVVGRHLMEPLLQRIEELGSSRTTLVACGVLSLLPLHAAVCPTRDDMLTPLLEHIEVSYIPSARALGQCRRALARNADRDAIIAGAGNPTGDLHYSQVELSAVGQLFPVARLPMRTEATKDTVFAALEGASYVHFSCHGAYNPVDVLSSSLRLADGDLTLRDLLDKRSLHSSRLVVVAACQSGIIDYQRPDEAIGLLAGFLQAGAAGVVGALWPVDDLSTALLMMRLYEYHLTGGAQLGESASPSQALRAAQSWLRRSTTAELNAYCADRGIRIPRQLLLAEEDDQPYENPYYWAPFIFVGA